MKKALIACALTALLCFSFSAAALAGDPSGRLFGDEEISLLSSEKTGVEEKIYWEKPAEELQLPDNSFLFGEKEAAGSDISMMMKNIGIYSANSELITAMHIDIDYAEIRNRPLQGLQSERWVTLRNKWGNDILTANSYISAGASQEEGAKDMPLVAGVSGVSRIYDLGIQGRVEYVSNVNAEESTSRMDVHLNSEYPLTDKWQTNLQFNWDIFGDSREPYQASATSLASASEPSVFSASSDNLSVMNAKVKCYPFRNLQLSLNYYNYTQTKARVSRYTASSASSRNSFLASRMTNGSGQDLGREINFSADLLTNYGISSNLLAGWYTPGNAYEESPSDENILEIRGEIVVSF
jgi:hypothetical protein